MKYVKVIGKFAKAKFMGATDEQAGVSAVALVVLIVILAAV